jgi:hypothetical protein
MLRPKKSVCIVTLAIVLAGCKRDDQPATSTERRAILPASELDSLARGYSTIEGARHVVLRESEIADLEARLPRALRTDRVRRVSTDNPLAERAASYLRQYIGYVDRHGRRWIWGNFMCRDPMEPVAEHRGRWRTRLVHMNDGGDCFFSLEYSPESHRFRYLIVNGDA